MVPKSSNNLAVRDKNGIEIFDLNKVVSIFASDDDFKINIYFDCNHSLFLFYNSKKEMVKIRDILISKLEAELIEL